MQVPRRYIDELLDQQATRLGISREALLQSFVAYHNERAVPALPLGYHRHSARVYTALVELGGAATSVELAQQLGIHRGNVDRHLARLRADGFVRSGNGVHVVSLTEEGQVAS